MTEAERELVEAMMATDTKNQGLSVNRARLRVAKERLDKEIPGWEQEAKSAYMFYRRAATTWYKWQARLERGGVYSTYEDSGLVDSWRDEYESENKAK